MVAFETVLFRLPQYIPREVLDFLKRADAMKDPAIRIVRVEVRCDQCGEIYPMSPREAYLPPPNSSNRGYSNYAPERYKKLLGCPICASHMGQIVKVIKA